MDNILVNHPRQRTEKIRIREKILGYFISLLINVIATSTPRNSKIIILNEETGKNVVITLTAAAPEQFLKY